MFSSNVEYRQVEMTTSIDSRGLLTSRSLCSRCRNCVIMIGPTSYRLDGYDA